MTLYYIVDAALLVSGICLASGHRRGIRLALISLAALAARSVPAVVSYIALALRWATPDLNHPIFAHVGQAFSTYERGMWWTLAFNALMDLALAAAAFAWLCRQRGTRAGG
jgi:hypothetical protein